MNVTLHDSMNMGMERSKLLERRMPEGGLFDGKTWRISPDPYVVEKEEGRLLEELGPILARFQDAAMAIYLSSLDGNDFSWVSELIRLGKPEWLLQLGENLLREGHHPGVIRPDLVWTEDGPRITELDAVPGGMGVLTWLMSVYEEAGMALWGGSGRMGAGFSKVFDQGIVVSEESANYLPEMEWLSERVNEWEGRKTFVRRPWEMVAGDFQGLWYRFFELFDLGNIPEADRMRRAMEAGDMHFSPPWTVANEEKLWLALYHTPQLREEWERRLSPSDVTLLDRLIPRGWLVRSQEASPMAVIAGLGVPSWEDVRFFSQKERRMALKISGFSPLGWGAKSVVIGHDVPGEVWGAAVDAALGDENHLWIAQEFHTAKVRPHRWWDGQDLQVMNGRTRVCPYYFRRGLDVTFGGALATVCPEDKKILHGMSEAVLTAVAIRD